MSVCYMCKESALVTDSSEGTLVCTECGTVQELNMWFDRVPCHLHGDEMIDTTTINRYDAIGSDNAHEFAKTTSKIPENMWNECNECYKSLTRTHSFRGNIKRGVFANCLYKVCCYHNIPRSLKEISEILKVPMALITRTSKYVDALGSKARQPLHTTGEDFLKMLPRYMEKMYTKESVWEIRKDHLEKDLIRLFTRPELLHGRTPHTKLTVCIYHHVRNHYNKKEFCKLFGVSVVTLNKSYKELLHDVSNLG